MGLKLDKRFNVGPGMEICFLGEGETKLEVICNEKFKNIDFISRYSYKLELLYVFKKLSFYKGVLFWKIMKNLLKSGMKKEKKANLNTS